ncbi:MAG TPA: hypothetical protein VN108_09200, partial [Marmoricola sp.]|nr:hypothetical protein [Marmoricola sp.]
LEATSAQGHQMATVLLTARSLHTTQIAQFARSGKSSPAPTSSATPLTPKTLRTQEQALVRELQALALQADRGDVAALLASAAAGIEQILVGMR